jgi:hypothetical protein
MREADMFLRSKIISENKTVRSIHEIVSEGATMHSKEILNIILQLCDMPCIKNSDELTERSVDIHPKNIFLRSDGVVFIGELSIPTSERQAYIPPEQNLSDRMTAESIIYALGLLMLFMATGNEKKRDLDTFGEDRTLVPLIEKCIAFDPKRRFSKVKDLSNAIRQKNTLRKKILSVAGLAFIVLAAVFSVLFFYSEGRRTGIDAGESIGYKKGYAEGYDMGFSDAPGIGLKIPEFDAKNGNISGNYVAGIGAIATRSEEEALFIMDGGIYRMDPYTGEIAVLSSDAKAVDINYYDGYTYFCTDRNVMRINMKTLKEEVFCETQTGNLYVVDGRFYLHDLTTGYLYGINPDTKSVTQLNGGMRYLSLNISDGKLYFIDGNDGNFLYSSNLDGGNLNLVNRNYFDSFCIHNGRIYASMAGPGGNPDNEQVFEIVSMDPDGGNLESLTTVSGYHPNVTDEGIFYIAGKNKTLEWISSDTKTRYVILQQPAESFNLSGRWIFYLNEQDGELWRVRVDGSGNSKVDPKEE